MDCCIIHYIAYLFNELLHNIPPLFNGLLLNNPPPHLFHGLLHHIPHLFHGLLHNIPQAGEPEGEADIGDEEVVLEQVPDPRHQPTRHLHAGGGGGGGHSL